MRRGNNNVFKVSGNLALGGTNEYIGAQNPSRGVSYGGSNSNTMKKPSNYGQSYENNYDYEYNKKSGTSESRKYSRNIEENSMGSYNAGMNYAKSSSKKIQYNYQNPLNKIESLESYHNKNSYKNTNSYNQPNIPTNSYHQSNIPTDSYKDLYNKNNYNPKNPIQKDQNYQRQTEEISKTKSKIQPQPSKIQPQSSKIQPQSTQQSITYNNRPLQKTTNTRQPPIQTQNRNTYQQQNDYSYSNTNEKQQIKEYDPSTFKLCRQGCGRKFNPDSISKHQKICKKVFQNKRPEFNVQEQRLVAKQQKKLMKQGEIVEKKMEQKKKIQQKKENMPKWKSQSLGLRAILKANRRGGQMTQDQKNLISKAQQSGMVKCKFCARSFSQKAAERHVPFCEAQQKKNAMKKKK